MEGHDSRPAAQRVARNTALRATTEIVGKIGSLVLFAYVARKLGRVTLGDFAFATACVQIVWSLAGFGLDRMALREIARDHSAADRLFFEMTGFKLAAGLTGIGVVSLAIWLAGYSARVQALVAILGVSLVLVLLSSSAQTVFQAHERMEYFFYTAVPNKVLAALLGIGILAAGGGIVGVAVGQLVAAACGLAIGMTLLYRRFAQPELRAHPRRWPRLARRAAPFGLQEVLGQIVFRVDIVLLSALTTAAVVGSYGAAYRILEATLFLAWSVGTSVLPMYSYLDRGSSPSLSRVFEGSLKFVAVIMTPIAVVLLVCARSIVDAIYGLPQYASSVPVLRWLAFAILAYSIGHLSGIMVLVRRPGRLTAYATAFVAAFNIVLNLILIPRFGAEGAAAATLATELLLAAISVTLARKVAGMPNWSSIMGGALVGGAFMALAMLPLSEHLALALPAGALAYLGGLALFEARSLSGDLAAVRDVLRSRSPVPPLTDGAPPGAL